MKVLRIATRKSPLALWQAEFVKAALEKEYDDLHIEIMGMMTEGDKLLATPLAEIGGKGLFVKELEKALLERRADIAVHSIKDMPVELPDGFKLSVVLPRDDARDAFISNKYKNFSDLSEGAVIGTSSLRRQIQLKAVRPELNYKNLRGNVGTRLRKLDEGEYDAIILAAAGLRRLGKISRVTQFFEPNEMLPAVGQAALGIECRGDDKETLTMIAALQHQSTVYCITAERAFSSRLGAGCQAPVAGYATLHANQMTLQGLVGSVDGKNIIRGEVAGEASDASQLGTALAEDLLSRGADVLLEDASHIGEK